MHTQLATVVMVLLGAQVVQLLAFVQVRQEARQGRQLLLTPSS